MKWYVSVLKTNIRVVLRIQPSDYKFGSREFVVINLTNYPKKKITARLLEKISKDGHLYSKYTGEIYTRGMKEILKLGYKIELPVPPNFTN